MSNRILGGQYRSQREVERYNGDERMRFGFTGNSHPRPANSDFAYEDPNNRDSILEMTRKRDSYYDPPEAVGSGPAHHSVNHDGQMNLFDVRQNGGHWTVDYMAATTGEHNDARDTIPTLLGLAAQHSLRTTGRVPHADTSLSKHSKRIVDKLVDRGLVENPFGKPKDEWDDGGWHDNHIDHRQGNEMAYGSRIVLGDPRKQHRYGADYAQKVRSADVESAQGLVKSALNRKYDVLKGGDRYQESDLAPEAHVGVRTAAGRAQEFHHTLQVSHNAEARANGRPRMDASIDHDALPGMQNPFPYRGA